MKKYSFVVLISLAACSIFNRPAIYVPTAIPGAINIIVAQTAAAASTQTAIHISPKPTPSFVPAPSQTPSINSTDTPTFIFLLPTSTVISSCAF
ncbi:MAG: hypothetical protein WBW94_04240, partial [Anaerolineales bacterium]